MNRNLTKESQLLVESSRRLEDLQTTLSVNEGKSKNENPREIEKIENEQIEIIKEVINTLSGKQRAEFIQIWYWNKKILKFEEIIELHNAGVDFEAIKNRKRKFKEAFQNYDMNTEKNKQTIIIEEIQA